MGRRQGPREVSATGRLAPVPDTCCPLLQLRRISKNKNKQKTKTTKQGETPLCPASRPSGGFAATTLCVARSGTCAQRGRKRRTPPLGRGPAQSGGFRELRGLLPETLAPPPLRPWSSSPPPTGDQGHASPSLRPTRCPRACPWSPSDPRSARTGRASRQRQQTHWLDVSGPLPEDYES